MRSIGHLDWVAVKAKEVEDLVTGDCHLVDVVDHQHGAGRSLPALATKVLWGSAAILRPLQWRPALV